MESTDARIHKEQHHNLPMFSFANKAGVNVPQICSRLCLLMAGRSHIYTMKDRGIMVIKRILIGTLLATGLIGLCFYFIYGIDIAIISIFSTLLGFTIIHLVLFYFWLNKKQ